MAVPERQEDMDGPGADRMDIRIMRWITLLIALGGVYGLNHYQSAQTYTEETKSALDVAMGLGVNPSFVGGTPESYFDGFLGEDKQFHYWRAAITPIPFNNKRWGKYAGKHGVHLVFQCQENQTADQVIEAVKEANEAGHAGGAEFPVVEFVEAWNEPFWTGKGDRYTDARVQAVKSGTQAIRDALKNDAATSYVKFIGPVVSPPPSGNAAPANFDDVADFAGIHAGQYKQETNAFKIDPSLSFMRSAYRKLPMAVTEFGASTGTGLSDEAQAVYIPRLWMSLISSMPNSDGPFPCLVYMHMNNPRATKYEAEFGLRESDGTPRPAWYTVKALHDELIDGDPSPGRQVTYTLSQQVGLHHIALAQKDRTLFIFWRDGGLGDQRQDVTLKVPKGDVGPTRGLNGHSPWWQDLPISREDDGGVTFKVGPEVVVMEWKG